jgi:hypothetical protein
MKVRTELAEAPMLKCSPMRLLNFPQPTPLQQHYWATKRLLLAPITLWNPKSLNKKFTTFQALILPNSYASLFHLLSLT